MSLTADWRPVVALTALPTTEPTDADDPITPFSPFMTPLLILAPLILLAAVGAVWKARPVHAALFLALTLSLTAVLYLVLGAEFIGLTQFMVYVGAVAVLIVFSLLIVCRNDESDEAIRRMRALPLGIACSLPVFVVIVSAVIRAAPVVDDKTPILSVRQLGELLFTTHAAAVIAVAVLLTAVMIGAALFAREDQPNRRS
jgi:NADH-quinone oxidoreductase subunit J